MSRQKKTHSGAYGGKNMQMYVRTMFEHTVKSMPLLRFKDMLAVSEPAELHAVPRPPCFVFRLKLWFVRHRADA